MLPEHEFPTSGRVTTVPPTLVGMAVDHVPDTVLDALEEDVESTIANGRSESGDVDAPMVRHVESSDNMFHPEFEQIQLTAVDEEGVLKAKSG